MTATSTAFRTQQRIVGRALGVIAAGLLAAATTAGAQDLQKGAELYQLCAQCHGANGGGNQVFLAPDIAGLDEWYVKSQLQKFRSGIRGTHPEDLGGLRMYPMSLSLKADEDLTSVAAYVASMPRVTPEPTLTGGDASKGAAAYGAICQTCHGAQGGGNPQMQAPPLAGMSDWYLAESLRKYKARVRGADPRDQFGAVMTGMAATLADEQAIQDMVAHIMTLSGK